MKQLILLLVLVLHSIRFYNDYKSASALTFVSASRSNENTFFSSGRYYQFEKGKRNLSLSFALCLCMSRLSELAICIWVRVCLVNVCIFSFSIRIRNFRLYRTQRCIHRWWANDSTAEQRRSSRLGENLNAKHSQLTKRLWLIYSHLNKWFKIW